jgi:hypothetical protein
VSGAEESLARAEELLGRLEATRAELRALIFERVVSVCWARLVPTSPTVAAATRTSILRIILLPPEWGMGHGLTRICTDGLMRGDPRASLARCGSQEDASRADLNRR